jgi:copper resistance protein C
VTCERIGGFGSALKDMLLQIKPDSGALTSTDRTEGLSNMKLAPALAFVACLTPTSFALAHAHLKTETPPADAVVAASPSALSLDFSEALEIGLSGVILREQDGRVTPTGAAVLAPNDDKKITVPLKGALSAGKYTVEWHALSKDGHATRGSYQFTVVP